MSLRNRFANFFNKPKSPEVSAVQDSERPSEQEHPAGSEAVTWDSLTAERQNDDKSSITYDDLARLVRFPGSAPAESVSVSESPEDAVEIANGGGVII